MDDSIDLSGVWNPDAVYYQEQKTYAAALTDELLLERFEAIQDMQRQGIFDSEKSANRAALREAAYAAELDKRTKE